MVKPKLAIALITALATMSMVTPSAVSASTVTVKKGDTLWGYSQKYDVSLNDILKENNIQLGKYMMWPGDKINIPDGTEQTGVFKNHYVDPIYEIKKNYNTVHSTQSSQQKSPVSPVEKQTTSSRVISAQPAKPKSVNKPATTQSAKVANSSEASAKEIIASRESGGSYTARSGRYYGRYQLDLSYLKGDLSVANQERTADKYVQNRYTTWTNALAHSDAYGWY